MRSSLARLEIPKKKAVPGTGTKGNNKKYPDLPCSYGSKEWDSWLAPSR